jgi:hypothetical protein
MSARPTFRPVRDQKAIDLTGRRFGLVTVTGPAPSIGHGARWKVRCECGAERFIRGCELREKAPWTHRSCRTQPVSGGGP